MSVPTISIPSSISLTRSPIFFTGKNNALAADSLESMSLLLKIFTGVKSVPSGAANYNLSKNYSINEIINFEVSDLIRPEFSHDFGVYNTQGYAESPEGEALWVLGYGDVSYDDNGGGIVSGVWNQPEEELPNIFLVTDGWAKLNNIAPTATTQLLLTANTTRYAALGNYETIPLYNSVTNDFGGISIRYSDNPSTLYTFNTVGPSGGVPPDPASTDTQDLVIYAGVGPQNLESFLAGSSRPSQHPTAEYYDVIFEETDSTPIATVRYNLVCEPKYTPYQIGFINRYGVAEYITFFKKSTEQGNFTQDQYQKSIYNDGFTTPSLQVGKYQSYNVNSRNTLTLNTGFVDEGYSETIKDLLMSESVVVLSGGSWISVVPQRGSVDYQKHINDKTINYTVTFDYGFDERSLVR